MADYRQTVEEAATDIDAIAAEEDAEGRCRTAAAYRDLASRLRSGLDADRARALGKERERIATILEPVAAMICLTDMMEGGDGETSCQAAKRPHVCGTCQVRALVDALRSTPPAAGAEGEAGRLPCERCEHGGNSVHTEPCKSCFPVRELPSFTPGTPKREATSGPLTTIPPKTAIEAAIDREGDERCICGHKRRDHWLSRQFCNCFGPDKIQGCRCTGYAPTPPPDTGKERTALEERVGAWLRELGLDDSDWYIPGDRPFNPATDDTGTWVPLCLFVPTEK